jgi:hypothetical protein
MDTAIFIDGIFRHIDDLGSQRNDCVRLDDHAVELQLHPSLADEVAGIFVIFEAADEVAAGRKLRASIDFCVAELAEHGIADSRGFRGEFRF